jgi:hypothetical protein
MDRARYDQLVKTFFACDPHAITGIFQEFLQAMQAQETLPPARRIAPRPAPAVELLFRRKNLLTLHPASFTNASFPAAVRFRAVAGSDGKRVVRTANLVQFGIRLSTFGIPTARQHSKRRNTKCDG